MAEPWLTIIGIGEDGLAGLTEASRQALDQALIVFGGPRHLELANCGDKGHPWPVPFDISPVLNFRGTKVVVLASGDPFSYGVGSIFAAALDPEEWRAIPTLGVFDIACARLGWARESTTCIGLHAAPFEKLRMHLHRDCRIIATLRDTKSLSLLTEYLIKHGYAALQLTILERIGGPHERIQKVHFDDCSDIKINTPVAVAICGKNLPSDIGLSRTPGRSENLFKHDGQITKSPIRAITLSTLAPRPNEMLWDIGAGSGSVSIEWALAGGYACAVECRSDRLKNIHENISQFGLSQRITAIQGHAEKHLTSLPIPNAVFVGGGASVELLEAIWKIIPDYTRFIVNAVTLETEALLTTMQTRFGGRLMRIEISESAPLGTMRGWQPSRPVVQWLATKEGPKL